MVAGVINEDHYKIIKVCKRFNVFYTIDTIQYISYIFIYINDIYRYKYLGIKNKKTICLAIFFSSCSFLSQNSDNQQNLSRVDNLFLILLRRCHKLNEFVKCIKEENEQLASILLESQNDTSK